MQNRTGRDSVARRVLEEKKGELLAAGNAAISESQAMWDLGQVQIAPIGDGDQAAGEIRARKEPPDRLVYEWALKAYTTMLDRFFKICGKSFQLSAAESKKKLKQFIGIDPQTCKPFTHPTLTCNAFGRLYERTGPVYYNI